jgi:hypothetical protein
VRKQVAAVAGVGVALALALAVAACGSGRKTQTQAKVPAKPAESMPSTSGGATMSADTGAMISVAAPTAGATVTGNAVPLDVSITHFTVACQYAGTPNQIGVGHYHVELDGSLINMFCSPRSAISLQNGKPGIHTLTVLAAENDHTDDMNSAQKVSFTYQPAKALPTIRGGQRAPRRSASSRPRPAPPSTEAST